MWTRNNESLWERAIVPQMSITGERSLPHRALQAALTWPDLLDARRADAIAVLSAQQVEMVRRSYRKDALLLPVGPPAHFFDPPDRAAARARLGIAEDAFLVVGMGTLVEHRYFDDLIEASALLADDPKLHTLIAGSDHEDPACGDRLAAQIAAGGLSERVTLPRKSLSDAELKDTYAAADVFVILSQRYAWGLAPLEALASGTPRDPHPGRRRLRHPRGAPRRAGGRAARPAGDRAGDPGLARGRGSRGPGERRASGCARNTRSTATWSGWSRSMGR